MGKTCTSVILQLRFMGYIVLNLYTIEKDYRITKYEITADMPYGAIREYSKKYCSISHQLNVTDLLSWY